MTEDLQSDGEENQILGLSHFRLFLDVEFERKGDELLVLLDECLMVLGTLTLEQGLKQKQNSPLETLVQLDFVVSHNLRPLLLERVLDKIVVVLVDLEHISHILVEEREVGVADVFGQLLVDFEKKGNKLRVEFVFKEGRGVQLL